MIRIFHGNDEEIHNDFQAWRKANVDGFHMTEKNAGQFVIHYAQDKRENSKGRGCVHQGCSFIEYLEDKNGCYTTARKVCSNSFPALIAWAKENGYSAKKTASIATPIDSRSRPGIDGPGGLLASSGDCPPLSSPGCGAA